MNSLERYIGDLNPAAWFNANRINGFNESQPINNSSISLWENLGNNYPNFGTINSNRQPVLQENIQNGNSGLLFTRGDSSSSIDADNLESISTIPSINYPYTFAIVAKPRILNGNVCGVFCNSSGGGIGFINNEYCLDSDGVYLSNKFRKNDYIGDTFLVIGVIKGNNTIQKIKVGDGEYLNGTLNSGILPNQIGGRYTDYNTNFSIWNPRNFDGWIFEILLFEEDITEITNREKLLLSYLKQKYNI